MITVFSLCKTTVCLLLHGTFFLTRSSATAMDIGSMTLESIRHVLRVAI